MIIVTGGAGFIGANIVQALNARGRRDILVVDNLENGVKFRNLADLDILDYRDKRDFIAAVRNGSFDAHDVDAVFHEGACSATTEWDGLYLMENNYAYSKTLLHWCNDSRIPYLYASSASVYGDGGKGFAERRECEQPLNLYAFSKFQFDQYLRAHWDELQTQVVGFRYFNVYGPREQHKGAMASVAFHHRNQLQEGDTVKLFEGTDGYGNGEQSRDFVYVGDCVDVNLWFLDHPDRSGIFNLGTGRDQPFNDVAQAVIAHHGRGAIEYIPFPDHLRGRYQSYTRADVRALRAAGYDRLFKDVAAGVGAYMQWLDDASA